MNINSTPIDLDKETVLDIELELSTLCNAKCPLCYRSYETYDEHYPTNIVRPLKNIINQLEEYPNIEWVRLVGSISEPTLYPHFFELVKYIKTRNVKIEICTNGSTNDIKWWEDLSLLLTKDDKIFFTICGSTQELHETYRVNTNLKKILENAKSFRSESKNDYAQCIQFDYNWKDLNSNNFQNMVNEFSNIYMTETFLPQNINMYKNKNFDITKFNPRSDKADSYFKIVELANKKVKRNIDCVSVKNKSVQVDIYGNVYPCYLFLEASKGKRHDWSYKKIKNGEYDVCKFCENSINKICELKDLSYII
jgi:MoaA/NifB/PqqE/SkfB family radical SAM enzyme